MSRYLRAIGYINAIIWVVVAFISLISFNGFIAFIGFIGSVASACIGSLLFFAMARILDRVEAIHEIVTMTRQPGENGPKAVHAVVTGQPGLLVRSVVPGGVAARGGVREGDIIVAYDDQTVGGDEELSSAVAAGEHKAGPFTLTVVRERRPINLSITPGRLGITSDLAEVN